jgi:hypothetical protein
LTRKETRPNNSSALYNFACINFKLLPIVKEHLIPTSIVKEEFIPNIKTYVKKILKNAKNY